MTRISKSSPNHRTLGERCRQFYAQAQVRALVRRNLPSKPLKTTESLKDRPPSPFCSVMKSSASRRANRLTCSSRSTGTGAARGRNVAGHEAKPFGLACCQRQALVHESELARNDPTPPTFHLPVAYDAGRPSPVI